MKLSGKLDVSRWDRLLGFAYLVACWWLLLNFRGPYWDDPVQAIGALFK